MPVELLTTFGKTPYEVTENLKRLSAAIRSVEVKVGALTQMQGVADIRAELQRLSARVDTLARQVQVLQEAP